MIITGRKVWLDVLVHDAWGDEAPEPRDHKKRGIGSRGKNRVTLDDGTILRSSYADGRLLTVEEWKAEMMAANDRVD